MAVVVIVFTILVGFLALSLVLKWSEPVFFNEQGELDYMTVLWVSAAMLGMTYVVTFIMNFALNFLGGTAGFLGFERAVAKSASDSLKEDVIDPRLGASPSRPPLGGSPTRRRVGA